MLNSQLKSLNISVLKNLKPNQYYISLEPLLLSQKEELEVGDIIWFKELNFIARSRDNIVAQLRLARVEEKEGFLVERLYSEPEPIENEDFLDSIKNRVVLDARVATILQNDIIQNQWIEFNWSIQDNLFIFIRNSPVATAKLLMLNGGFGLEILEKGSL